MDRLPATEAFGGTLEKTLADTPEKTLVNCRTFLGQLANWSKVLNYVRNDPDFQELKNPNTRRQHERTLKDLDTGVIAILLVMRHYQGRRLYTLGELASAIEGKKNTSEWKAAQQRIKRILTRVGDHYGLFDYGVVMNPRDGQNCYQIRATERLVRFVEDELFQDGSKLNLEPPLSPCPR